MAKAKTPPAPLDEAWRESRNVKPRTDLIHMKPGIYHDIPFADYCMINAINQSTLAVAKQSMMHYRYTPRGDSSPAFRFGSLVHSGKLEPHKLSEQYVVIPDSLAEGILVNGQPAKSPRATSEYKERLAKFLAANPGKQEVSQEWMENLGGMLKSLLHHERASKLFSKGEAEITIVWDCPFTGIRCKGRIDWGHYGGKKKVITDLVDLKTTEDVCEFYLDKWDYHFQGAFYNIGWHTLTGDHLPIHFAVCEKNLPHAVRCAPIGNDALMVGRSEVEFLMRAVKQCQETRKWPGPADPATWELSRWYKPDWRDRH